MIQIFYVEDEPFLAKIVKETLVKNDYKVELYTTGTMAAEAFDVSKYDICVLDIMLPGMNGYDLSQRIRTSAPEIPILFLTAKDQTEDLIKGFKSGGNDYIKKPFSIEELIVRINNLLNLTKLKIETTKVNDVLKIGKYFKFYCHKQVLAYQEQEQKLSYKQSQLLTLLSTRINEPVARKEILLSLWEDDSFYNSRNLDVYITKLRSYLKKDSTVKLITLKGVGYRLSVD